jgi:hypothetical protein
MANALVPSNVPQADVKKIDSISNVPYRIGYSFRQPKTLKPLTRTNVRPFFAMDWAIKGPSQVKEELYNKGVLQRFPTVWRRAAKEMNVNGLGVVGNRKELPSFQELGQAPGPTDKTTVNTDVGRSMFGFLDNLIKTTGGAIAQSQQLEIMKAQAQSPYMATGLPRFFTPGEGGLGILGWTAILGTLGAGAYFYMRNR